MDIISVLLILSCLLLLGSSRLHVAIRVIAVQGVLLAVLPIIRSWGDISLGIWILGLSTILSKGILLPWLMSVCLRHTGIRREIEPFIGFGASLLCGTALLALAVWITARLHLPGHAPLILATSSFFAMFVGLFLMVTRRKAITQSLAYLVMENGVYGIGISMSLDFPFLVELGILLDVFVGVFLMGNLLFHLDHEFEHLDTDKLTELSDLSDVAQPPSAGDDHPRGRGCYTVEEHA
ncbi:MAG: hydrogenase [Planctomycetaceae bacterium]|nr:MAG: hydrogenase [Planctomycetaceae bacterium]